jgi:hypothetical protein
MAEDLFPPVPENHAGDTGSQVPYLMECNHEILKLVQTVCYLDIYNVVKEGVTSYILLTINISHIEYQITEMVNGTWVHAHPFT